MLEHIPLNLNLAARTKGEGDKVQRLTLRRTIFLVHLGEGRLPREATHIDLIRNAVRMRYFGRN